MLRWLTRLLIFGVIVAVAGFVVSRILNREEDFDDFDDIDAGLEFQETPVEIDVAAEDTASTGGAGSGAQAGNMTSVLDIGTEAGAAPSLLDISGIGPAYEARLQSVGINTIEDLANADPAQVASQIDVIGGEGTIEGWIQQAKEQSSQSATPGTGE
jgi:predicted flap endonuclease-1-like 5' DNA nuclease